MPFTLNGKNWLQKAQILVVAIFLSNEPKHQELRIQTVHKMALSSSVISEYQSSR